MSYIYEDDNKQNLYKKILKELILWIIEISLVIGLAYLIVNYAVEKTSVIGDSMDTTLQNDNKIIINKFSYYFSDPKRFDIIVFKQTGKEHSFYSIKRVIALPGETIQIIAGDIYINDVKLDENIKIDSMTNGGLAEDAMKLEKNEYFVLGDNRNNSEDSRFANIGNIVKEDIIGEAWIRLNPFDFIKQINVIDEDSDQISDLDE